MKRRLKEWLAGGCVVGALGALHHWHGGASTLYLVLLAVWILFSGMLLQWLGPRKIIIERRLSDPVITAGETAMLQVEIRFRSLLPVPWLAVEDYYTGGSSRQILFPGFRRRLAYSCELRSLPRGVYSFDACLLEWGGLFGWFKGERAQKAEGRLLVLPKPLPALGAGSPSAVADGTAQPALTAERRQGVKGPEVRPYLPTDPSSRIHWKSFAKRGSLHSFLPEEERDPFCMIVLDRSYDGYSPPEGTEEQRRQQAKPAFERAVSAAAGMLTEMMRYGAESKLICGSSNRGMDDAANSAASAKDRLPGECAGYSAMLAALAPLALSEGPSAASMLEENLKHAKSGTRVIVITGGLNESLSEAAARLLARGVLVDVYCTALNAGTGELGGKREKHAGTNSAFAAAIRLSRMGAGIYAVDPYRVSRMGPIGPLRSGEGAV
ncbi:DUF58 domain-containing protein [Paenibacillus sp. VCA1]|uniref:DUF58 domain-containing protein n=1 Tax=Paenibacillus sp. VCA1 TaxID=3039148 RepID=UPI002872A6F2|nr:DUF58 domain-containing protein [Paenibacillus sp. VCA1]MDR9852636.1 DUF58 domain-containing protein [Paenibacillus sp. VCA1]